MVVLLSGWDVAPRVVMGFKQDLVPIQSLNTEVSVVMDH